MRWMILFFSVSSVYGQVDNKIVFYCPNDWSGDTLVAPFSKDRKYFGVHEKSKQLEQSRLSLYKGRDTIIDFGWGKRRTIVKIKSSPTFIVAGLDMKDSDIIKGKHLNGLRLYPGQSVSLFLEPITYVLYATGQYELDSIGVNPFKRIKNYRLMIRSVQGTTVREQVIYGNDMNAWPAGGYGTGISLIWMGDLNNDKALDIVLTSSTYWTDYHVQLYLGQTNSDEFIKEVSKYVVSVD